MLYGKDLLTQYDKNAEWMYLTIGETIVYIKVIGYMDNFDLRVLAIPVAEKDGQNNIGVKDIINTYEVGLVEFLNIFELTYDDVEPVENKKDSEKLEFIYHYLNDSKNGIPYDDIFHGCFDTELNHFSGNLYFH